MNALHATFALALLITTEPLAAQTAFDNVMRAAREYHARVTAPEHDREMARLQARELLKAETAQRDRERSKARAVCSASGRRWDYANQFCK